VCRRARVPAVVAALVSLFFCIFFLSLILPLTCAPAVDGACRWARQQLTCATAHRPPPSAHHYHCRWA
jgi:hypothetical protein